MGIILSYIDILGSQPNLNFNGKKKVTNSFTKLFSLILIALTIFIALILSSEIIFRNNPLISNYRQFSM